MIAIHKASGGFSNRWIKYCDHKGIAYKIVDCYKNDIVDQLSDCSALLWQFYQGSIKDSIMAKALMNALEHAGVKTFPDFKTSWHFDDKVGQKYLLEVLGAPLAPTWVFYDQRMALNWASEAEYPKVIKLRGGSGSQNVKLVRSRKQARRLINQAFGRGFPAYNAYASIKDRWRFYKQKKAGLRDLLEGFARFLLSTPYSRMHGRDRGYIYFQEYIGNNTSDIRVVVVEDKAFAIKRLVRQGDFRASGSGSILYAKELIDESTLKLSFEVAGKLEAQCVAFDFVYKDSDPIIVEISYGFTPEGYEQCPGYWDRKMNWHEGKFDPYGWMIENVVNSLEHKI